jgi:hypothetical protein
VAIHNEDEAFALLFAEHDQKTKTERPAVPAQPAKPGQPPHLPSRGADGGRAFGTPERVEEPTEDVTTDWFTLPELEASDTDPGQQPPFSRIGGTPVPQNVVFYGGLLVIGVAAVWFLAGLAAGLIFYYPPILVVVGLVALVIGITKRGVRGNGRRVAAGKGG